MISTNMQSSKYEIIFFQFASDLSDSSLFVVRSYASGEAKLTLKLPNVRKFYILWFVRSFWILYCIDFAFEIQIKYKSSTHMQFLIKCLSHWQLIFYQFWVQVEVLW